MGEMETSRAPSSRPDTAPELAYLLGDADPDVRLAAALGLGEQADSGVAGALVHRFGLERDFQVREALTWAALRIREAALPLVIAELGSPNWLARLQAVHTIGKAGRRADGEVVATLAGDPIDSVAERAYWAAAQTRNPCVIPALVASLGRGDATHRNSLTVALASFGASAVPALADALGDPAAAVRCHAAETLSDLGGPEADQAAQALIAAVRDSDGAVRLAALNALGHLRVRAAWLAIDEVALCAEPRLRHLAQRLAERRPAGAAFAPLVTLSLIHI